MNRELLEHSLRGEAGDGFLPVLFKAGVVFGFKAGFQCFQVQRQGGDAFGERLRQAEVLPGRLVARAALAVLVVRGRKQRGDAVLQVGDGRLKVVVRTAVAGEGFDAAFQMVADAQLQFVLQGGGDAVVLGFQLAPEGVRAAHFARDGVVIHQRRDAAARLAGAPGAGDAEAVHQVVGHPGTGDFAVQAVRAHVFVVFFGELRREVVAQVLLVVRRIRQGGFQQVVVEPHFGVGEEDGQFGRGQVVAGVAAFAEAGVVRQVFDGAVEALFGLELLHQPGVVVEVFAAGEGEADGLRLEVVLPQDVRGDAVGHLM